MEETGGEVERRRPPLQGSEEEMAVDPSHPLPVQVLKRASNGLSTGLSTGLASLQTMNVMTL